MWYLLILIAAVSSAGFELIIISELFPAGVRDSNLIVALIFLNLSFEAMLYSSARLVIQDFVFARNTAAARREARKAEDARRSNV